LPARRPQSGPSRLRPWTYVPPDSGYSAASSADEVALQYATNAAITSPSSNPAPAAAAAGPIAANTPAPIIEPRPIMTASVVPSLRASRLEWGDSRLARGLVIGGLTVAMGVPKE